MCEWRRRCIVWLTLSQLDFASPIASAAVFSLATVALDLSYGLPIFFRLIFAGKEGVDFKPGPFYLGDGLFGKFVNWVAVIYILFECIILSFPENHPVTGQNMNYAGVITIGVMLIGLLWYVVYARRHYFGPNDMVEFPVDHNNSDEAVLHEEKKAGKA